MKKECEARLRSLVAAGEPIVAVGTAEELPRLERDIGSGGGWTLVLVTSTRVLFARWASPGKPHEEILLDEITLWAYGTQYNCEALVLTHPPITRRHRGRRRKLLRFEWHSRDVDETRITTILRFSRPDTAVAKALHAALEQRSVPHELLEFEENTREERTRGSRVELRVKEK